MKIRRTKIRSDADVYKLFTVSHLLSSADSLIYANFLGEGELVILVSSSFFGRYLPR